MGVKATVVAVFAALLMALAVAPGAQAAKLDNPSPPNFRAEVSGGYLQFIGSTGTPLQLPLDFSTLDPPLPNPALVGTITPNSAGYGVISVPQTTFANCNLSNVAGICFPPIPVNIDDIALSIRLQPVGPATGFIDPLSGRVDLNLPIRLKAEGSALGQALGDSCYVGSAGTPISLNTTTHIGTFPTTNPTPPQTTYVASFRTDGADFAGGWLAAQPYSDESGVWPSEPKPVSGFPVDGASKPTPSQIPYNELTDFIPRAAGAWRGMNETLAAPAASGCGTGLLQSTITGQVNSLIGLPSQVGDSSASLDFKFSTFTDRPTTNDAILRKAVKSRFVAPGISSSPWPTTEKPTAVSAQTISINASTSYFKTGGNATERYSFDFGTGTFGAWGTTPTDSFTAPTLAEGANPVDLPIRVRVKDTEGDIDITTRNIRVVPATDISIDTSASSVAGAGKLRAGSIGDLDIDVKNNSTNDASSLPLQLNAALPTGVTITNFSGPNSWTCSNTASTISCSLPGGGLVASGTSHFDVTVDVATGTANPAAITSSVTMAGDPTLSNNTKNISVPVVKTDLSVELTRTTDLVANGWTPYEIAVANAGDGTTVGGSTVNVSLPADFSYRAIGSGGTDWTCATPVNPRDVVCSRSAEITGNSSAPTLTVVAKIDRTAAAAPATVTAVVSTQGDVNAFNGADSDDDTATVQVLPDLTVDASFAGSYIVGDPGSINLTATNEAVVPVSGPTTVTATLPAGLTVDSASGTGWSCAATVPGSSEISCELAAGLAAGETSTPVTAALTVVQAAYPGVTIGATVANANDGFALNNSDSLDVQVRRLDVAIQKLAVKPFNVGIEGRYRLNVTNTGDAPTIGNITVIDTLPAGLRLKGVSGAGWDCSNSTIGQQNISCVLTSVLGPGVQAAPIEARVDVLDEAAEAGTVVNTAYVDTVRDTRGVTADDAITANNTSTVSTTAVAVDLSIESQHPGDFLVDTQNVYSLTVRNVGFFGTDPGEAITVTDDLPAGITPIIDDIEITRPGWVCEEVSGDVECVLEAPSPSTSAMDPESAVTIDIPVQVTDAAADSSNNVAEVSTARDSNPTLSPNNLSTDPTTVKRIDLNLDTEQTIAPRAGGIGELSVDLNNIGSAGTTSPSVVTIPLASGTSYRATGSTTLGWTCISPGAGTQITCTRSQSIANGGSAPALKVRTNVGAAAPATWTTTSTVSTNGEPSTRLANNTDSVDQTLETVNLTVAKTHDPANVKSGKRSSFKINVTNIGNTASNGTIRVDDAVNSTFTNVSASGPGWTCPAAGNAVSCTRTASLPAGQTAPSITVAFDVPNDASGTRNSIATVTHSGDPFGSNNSAGDPIEIVSFADIAVSIEQPEAVRVGDDIDITYLVRNIGAESTSGSPSVRLRVGLSSGLEALSASSDDAWDCATTPATQSTGAFMECELGEDLEAGDSSSLTGQFEVVPTDDSQVATLVNGTTAGDINRSNNYATALSDLSGFDLEATVDVPSGGSQDLEAGVTATRAVTVRNVGTSSTTNEIKVKVALPDGVQYDGSVAPGASWTCVQVVRNLTCDRSGAPLAANASATVLNLGLRASKSNAPSVTINYSAQTLGDENASNDLASRTDTVLYKPDTTITSSPSTSTAKTGTVTFTSDDPAATFECKVDTGAFAACTSPLNLTGLAIGAHSVSVQAKNASNMIDPTPAVASWNVNPIVPTGDFKNVKGTLTGGELSLASLGSVPLPAQQITLEGKRYTNDGALLIPKEGVHFEPVVQSIPDVLGPGTVVNVEISISATGDGLGSLPNGGGASSLVLPVRADVKAKLGTLSVIPDGTECALNPVSFDLAGTYNEGAKTVSLSSNSVAFPQVTGCANFKTVIDDLLELPRNDISISMDFSLEEIADQVPCPAGTTGTFQPDCTQIVEPGPAVLAKPTVKGPKKIKSGKTATLTASVKNTGGSAASNVKVCLTLKKAKKLAKGKAVTCKTVSSIAAGATGKAKFKVKTKKVTKTSKLAYKIKATAGAVKSKELTGTVSLLK